MPKKWKVFIAEPLTYEGTTHKEFEENNCDVIIGRPTWKYPDWKYSDEELIEACKDVDGVMGASRDSYTRRLMESAKRLRVISKYGIGVEKIDIKAATDNGILVANTPVVENVYAVAEHAIALMLGLSKRLSFSYNHAKNGKWRDQSVETRELFGKTIGIIGLGRIGIAIVERLTGWNTKLLGYDPYKTDDEFKRLGVLPVSLEELLKESDIVSISVVATSETKKAMGEGQLKLMKKNAYLINTSRGEVLDEKALVKALQEGWIAGAGLDVTDPEPPLKDNPLFNMENVIITPHIAGWTRGTLASITKRATENLIKALKGELPESFVNPEAVPKWRERIIKIEEMHGF